MKTAIETAIVIAVIAVILGLAIWYVIKSKKSGKKCIGCPDGCCTSSQKKEEFSCSGSCSCCCGCSGEQTNEK